MVDHAVQLVCLLACRIEPAEGPEIVVLLDSRCPYPGKIVGDTRRRREFDILDAAVGRIENRVDDDVHRLEVPADDRSDFGSKAARVPPLRVVTEFEVRAVEEPPVFRMRQGEEEAYFGAV